MSVDQRRRAVAELLDADPSLSQRAIAERLGVSQKTISRDLAAVGQFVTNLSGRAPAPVSPQVNGVSRGDSLVKSIVAEMRKNGLEPDSREEQLLDVARRLADRLDVLDQLVARDGVSRTVNGRVALHPGLAESRQVEAVLVRALAGIQLEETHKNATKQRAANTRWASHRLKAVARGES